MGVLATQGIDRSDRARHVLQRTAEHENLRPQGDDWVMIIVATRKAITPDRIDRSHRRTGDSVATAKKQLV
jgi:hypothetical protein